MAKKTSRNAVKKINKQLEMFSSSPKNNSKKSSTSQKKTVKKSTTSNSKSKSNVRDTVIIPSEKKESPKKKSTVSSKNVRDDVVVAPQKKTTSTTSKKKSTSRNVRGEVVVTTTKARTSTKNTSLKKKENVIDPVELDHNVESIISDLEKEEKVEKIVVNESDRVDVAPTKKKLTEKEYDELKLDKPIDLDNFDLLDDYRIIDEFEEDIYKDKKKDESSNNVFKKRKSHVSISKKNSYRELENDLRSLYDKVNDVVSDIDHSDRKKIVKDNIDLTDNKDILKNNYKEKIKEYEIDSDIKPEKFSLLDLISQKVLNFFLIFLLIIFTGMTIAFIWFLIYVSTF